MIKICWSCRQRFRSSTEGYTCKTCIAFANMACKKGTTLLLASDERDQKYVVLPMYDTAKNLKKGAFAGDIIVIIDDERRMTNMVTVLHSDGNIYMIFDVIDRGAVKIIS